MSLKELSPEQLQQKSMLELAAIVLRDAKKALEFQQIYDEVTELKGFTKAKKEDYIAQFYTELNVDGRFMTLGDNVWGLKDWYPVDKQEEEITSSTKTKKKKKDDLEEEELKVAEDGFDAIDDDIDFDEEEEEFEEEEIEEVLDDDIEEDVEEVEIDEEFDEDEEEEEEN